MRIAPPALNHRSVAASFVLIGTTSALISVCVMSQPWRGSASPQNALS